jgi:hypothetical protein
MPAVPVLAQSAGVPSPRNTNVSLLKKFADDAYYLHNYGITIGKQIPAALSKTIIEMSHRCDETMGAPVDDELEVRFMTAYGELAALMLPVTVESLRDTEEIQFDPHLPFWKQFHWPKARQVAFLLPFIAIILILLILVCEIVQSIFIPGMRDIQSKEVEVVALQAGGSNAQSVQDQMLKKSADVSAILQNLKATWDNTLGVLPGLEIQTNPNSLLTQDAEQIRLLKTRFAILVEALNRLLPVLYGALGATAYLLRVLIRHITLRTFNKKQAGSISVRICLGMLSGIAIQWFFVGPQAQIFERSLSTSAVAFLAGYSVDLVFNVMDRLVQGFKPAKPGSQKISEDSPV